ncbi:hypothetical protein [Labrys sp. ZIDIC5]|uniref:hypothetical protein n=1 Tax=Labrys sedimenti TaxID=3106036 RepID=UPI002ACA038D|nr:hypothetical protein [Labrys sp. ZIDIC5]MDZ5449414.1 hypothetical protein [Labrys sp. ZIDIC5]
MQAALLYVFRKNAILTFAFMGIFGGMFAVSSYNLLELFRANFDYITSYGVMGLMEGGARQFLELVFYGYTGIACYILFKGCLYGLLDRVSRH